jgi:hypothetical protein
MLAFSVHSSFIARLYKVPIANELLPSLLLIR